MFQVLVEADNNGNIKFNGKPYLSSGIQLEQNADDPEKINIKYLNNYILFGIHYSDFIDENGLSIATSYNSLNFTLLKKLEDNVFFGTVFAAAGVFSDDLAISAEGDVVVNGKVTASGGVSATLAPSSLVNTTITTTNVANSPVSLIGGAISGLGAYNPFIEIKSGILSNYSTYINALDSGYTADVNINLPSQSAPSAEGSYTMTTDGVTGATTWTDISSLGSSPWTESGNNIYYNTGNVGIGTTIPRQKLHVDGNAQFSDGSTIGVYSGETLNIGMVGGSSSATVAFTDSNVGIGTTTPSEKLHVSGNIRVDTGDRISMGSTGLSMFHSGTYAEATNYTGDFIIRNTAANKDIIFKAEAGTGSDVEIMRIDGSSGNVGIGTTSPSDTLQVNGTFRSNAFWTASNGVSYWGNGSTAYGGLTWDIGYATVYSQTGNMLHLGANGASPDVTIDTSGRVGIGTASPSKELEVDGGIRIGANEAIESNGGITVVIDVNNNETNRAFTVAEGSALNPLFTVNESGNVGIGTTSPRGKLDARGRVDFSQDLRLRGTDALEDQGVARFYVDNTNKLHIDTGNNGSDLFAIDGSGNVGIGTTSPSAKLDVVGLANINDGSDNVMISSGNTALTTGTENTAVGKNAGIGISTGTKNTAVGKSALGASAAATSGSNTAVGHSALYQATGGSNVAVGRNAGLKAGASNVAIGAFSLNYTTGDTNVAVGVNALSGDATSTFSGCVAVGYNALNALTTGSSNSAVGYNTLKSTTSGSYNVAFGSNALESNLTGVSNSAFGTEALRYNTGANNTAFGTASLRNKTSGDNNSAFGVNALYNNLTGSNNIAVGRNAGYYTTGSNNALIGYYAGYGSATSTFSNTVAIGYQALYDLTTGDHNTAIGYQASANAQTGDNNVSLGNYALYVNQTGGQNTAIGYGAAYQASSNANTAVGFVAGYYGNLQNTSLGSRALNYSTGSYNVALGSNAAQGVSGSSTFSNTTAVGYSALGVLTTGSSNTGVGYRALASNLTGGNNTAVGNIAGVNIIGGNNTVMGFAAGSDITGGSNTAIGFRAGEDVGNDNAMVGREAGRFTNGSNNVAIGNYAAEGVEATSTFSNTVAVGYQAGTSLTTGGSNILIGYQAGSTLTTESNKLYIENSNSTTPLIYGEFDNDILRVNGTLQVGDPAGTGFALPSTDGTANQVLSTDGAGAVTWVDQSGGAATDAEIGFAYKTTDQTLTGTFTAISAFDGEFFDDLTAFDTTTGALTITDVGHYLINIDVMSDVTSGTGRSGSEIYLEFNGSEVAGSRRGMYNRNDVSGYTSASITFPYYHSTGTATFKVMAAQTSGTDTVIIDNCTFSYSTLGGTQGPQGVSGDAFDVSTEASGRTLVAGDHLKYLRSTSAMAVTFTVPPQSSVSWVDNAEIVFEQAGAGQITIAAGAGVTINTSETLKSGQQYAVIGLKRVASDTWTLTGERELAP